MLRAGTIPLSACFGRGVAALMAMCFAGSLTMSGCLGGSDGVENPKMEMEFHPSDGATSLSGRVSLYAKNLDPVQDSVPLLSKDFSGLAQASFTPEEMDSALHQALLRNRKDTSGIRDTILEFNVVASAADREAFLGGFRYRRAGSQAGFARTAPGAAGGDFGVIKETYDFPKAVRNFTGRVGLQGKALGLDYIFIPGSPYHATVDSTQGFKLLRLSPGAYSIAGADTDSALFFESTDSLNTTDTAYTAKAWDVVTIFGH